MSSKVVDTDLNTGVLHNDEWKRRWDVKEINFHKTVHAAILDKEETKMFEGKTKSIFAPLCGKSKDLKWMYDKGHTVAGVEIAELAVQEFFAESEMGFEVQELDKIGKLYKSKDDRMKLYVADLYDLNADLVGQFDVIYDCRSLVAINLEDHQMYRDLMLSLMKKDGICVIMTIEYNEECWPGPPHSTNDKLIRDLYGERCSIELLEEIIIKNEEPVKQGGESTQEKPTAFGAAIKLMSKMIDRWYYLTFK